jgi:hypothetical protein
MTYTAWSADGRVIAFDELPPAHRIYDDETENGGSRTAGGVEQCRPSPCGSPPNHTTPLPQHGG